MKTIFISIFEGVEAKNILRTPIIETLIEKKDLRIVFFTKNEERVEYYKNEFNNERFLYEVVARKPLRGFDSFFAKLKFTLLKTKTTDLKRKMAYDVHKNPFLFYGGLFLSRVLANSLVRRISRFADYALVKDSTYDKYFEKYKPDLVFLAHLFDEPENDMLRASKKFGVKSVGFVNSWDKGTARCIFRLLPDKVVVFNDIVKKEMVLHNEISEKDIFVSGLPQYDLFTNYKPISKEEFYKKHNFDLQKNLIVYAPMGSTFGDTDWQMIDLLQEKIKNNEIASSELLVRFQPNDFIDEKELKKRNDLKYDYPGKRFTSKRGVDWDMDGEDLKNLADTLKNMSVLVCFASSISMDALAYDKPTVAIGFEPISESGKRLLQKSPIQYYHTEHYINVMNTNGVTIAHNPDELVLKINLYLENPSYNQANRIKLKKEQWQFEDGKSGERIANFVRNEINYKSKITIIK